jgi:hypothetical protein
MQAMNKESLNLAFDMTKQLTSRPAASEVMLALKANPNLALQPDASKRIMDMIEGISDYKLAQQQGAMQWRQNKGTLEGFEADWNKNNPITKYVNIAAIKAPMPQGAIGRNEPSQSSQNLKLRADGGYDYDRRSR